jgi:GNAT superfamily N-acetyltransferase
MSLNYPDHATALYEALRPDPYFAALESWVEHGSARDAMIAYYDFSMREAREYGRLHLPGETQYGVSIWLTPLDDERALEKKRRREAFLAERFGDTVLDRYRDIVSLMSANSAPLVDERAWYLSIVGVSPRYQNRGLGAGLIEPVLAEADEAGVSTYLETFTPRNRPFYNRLGYLEAAVFHESTTGAEYALMIRRPDGDAGPGEGV